MNRVEIKVVENSTELAALCANRFLEFVRETVATRKFCAVALSGGSTPKRMYELMGQARYRTILPWDKVHFFWTDERDVPPTDPKSNYAMAWKAWLQYLDIPSANIHRFVTESRDPSLVVRDYHDKIQSVVEKFTESPRFDIILLGVGPEGHTASLFPDAEVRFNEHDRVIASWVPKLNEWRYSMTSTLINSARQVNFIVSGAEKAEIVEKILEGGAANASMPARKIQLAEGSVTWYLDKDAARLLRPRPDVSAP